MYSSEQLALSLPPHSRLGLLHTHALLCHDAFCALRHNFAVERSELCLEIGDLLPELDLVFSVDAAPVAHPLVAACCLSLYAWRANAWGREERA